MKVGYSDWELDAGTQRGRLEQLFGAEEMPDVRYVRCERPLVYEVDRLRRFVRDDALTYAVLDSVAFGTDGAPEAAESAMGYARAVRQLGIGTLAIAHITKGDNGDQPAIRLRVLAQLGALDCTYVKSASTSPDGRLLTIGVFNRKANLGPLRPAFGLEVEFVGERVSICPTDIAAVDELAAEGPVWQRIRVAIQHTPRTIAELSDELGVKVDTIQEGRGAPRPDVHADPGRRWRADTYRFGRPPEGWMRGQSRGTRGQDPGDMSPQTPGDRQTPPFRGVLSPVPCPSSVKKKNAERVTKGVCHAWLSSH